MWRLQSFGRCQSNQSEGVVVAVSLDPAQAAVFILVGAYAVDGGRIALAPDKGTLSSVISL